jgi:hypothetical protein
MSERQPHATSSDELAERRRWPLIVPPLVFGGGGVLIITSLLLTCWFWAQARTQPLPAQRRGADLRLLAYVIFGFAAFWT